MAACLFCDVRIYIQIYIEGGFVVPESSQLCFYSLRTVFTVLPHSNPNIASWPAKPLMTTLWVFTEEFANPCFRVVLLKFLSTPYVLEVSLKHRLLGPNLSFWFSRCRMEPEYLPVS